MTTWTMEAHFEVISDGTIDLEERADALMEQLLALEEAACGIHSSSVAADLGLGTIEVMVSVDGDEDAAETARRVGESCIRAAILAAGDRQDMDTPWDVDTRSVTAVPISA